jgi:hypothetical protein
MLPKDSWGRIISAEMRTALNPFRSLPYIRMYGKIPRSFFLSCMLRIDRVSVAIRRCQPGRVCRACRASTVGRRGVATKARLTGGASGTLEVPKVESHFLEYI